MANKDWYGGGKSVGRNKVRYNLDTLHEILTCDAVKRELMQHAESIKKTADGMSKSGSMNATIVEDTHAFSAHVHVMAEDDASRFSNRKHNSLVKAIGIESKRGG